jgi:hypothetical protein
VTKGHFLGRIEIFPGVSLVLPGCPEAIDISMVEPENGVVGGTGDAVHCAEDTGLAHGVLGIDEATTDDGMGTGMERPAGDELILAEGHGSFDEGIENFVLVGLHERGYVCCWDRVGARGESDKAQEFCAQGCHVDGIKMDLSVECPIGVHTQQFQIQKSYEESAVCGVGEPQSIKSIMDCQLSKQKYLVKLTISWKNPFRVPRFLQICW